MARNKDAPKIWRSYGEGTGGYRRLDYMTDAEVAEREAQQKPYEAMLARQQAYEDSLIQCTPRAEPEPKGCVFAKSCNLPNAIIDYTSPSGAVPTDTVNNYGELTVRRHRRWGACCRK